MKPILNLTDLKEGAEYSMFNKQFNTTNICRFVCGDTLGLNRPIAYFQFAKYKPITKEQLTANFKENIYTVDIFAIWEHDLQDKIIIEV